MKSRLCLCAVGAVLALPSIVLAHPQHGFAETSGLLQGFVHPWGGLDHLLAMLAVGMLSVRRDARTLWLLPAAFIGTMILGGVLGMQGVRIPSVELGIALTVAVFGGALAAGKAYRTGLVAVLVGIAGLLHGHAHGAEMPAMVAPGLYAAGFLAATAALHLAGIVAGHWLLGNKSREIALRLSGGVIACVGLLLASGLI